MKLHYTFFLTILLFCIGCQKMLEPPSNAKAAFTYSIVDSTKYPITVKFNNTSTGAISYNWDLGNGTTSMNTSPTGEYASSLTYHVKLTAINGSQTDTFSQNISLPYITKSVVLVYVLPSDVQYDEKDRNTLVYANQTLQSWFKQQMAGKSYHFTVPLIEVIKSSKPSSWFLQNANGNQMLGYLFYNAIDQVKASLGAKYVPSNNIFSIGLPINSNTPYTFLGVPGFAIISKESFDALAGINAGLTSNEALGLLGHSIGHALGLVHTSNSNGIMYESSPGNGFYTFPNCILVPEEKLILNDSGFFFF